MALIGIDIGGTGAKVFSFSENGKILAHEYREHEPIRQKPGCFELDASKIWESIENMIYIVAQKSNESVTAITVSSLGECFVCLDKDDNILSKCITYHDSRGKDSFKKFQEDFKKETIEYILEGAHPSFVQTLFRLLIIKHTQPDVLKKTTRICFLSDFILHMLGGNHCCDYSLAATTGCFNQKLGQWHVPFLDWAEISPSILPQPVPTGTCIGKLSKTMGERLNIHSNPLLILGGNDQLASSIGANIYHPGEVFNAIGTADAMRTFTYSADSAHSAYLDGFSYERHYFPDLYVINPGANYSGAVLLKWFRDHFCRLEKYFCIESGEDFYNYYENLLPKKPTNLLIYPQFTDVSAEKNLGGTITNLTLDTKTETIYRAFMEGESFLMRSRLEKIKNAGFPVNIVKTIGGAAKSEIFMQLRADILNIPIATINYDEPGALGNAILGGIATGLYQSASEISSRFIHTKKIFYPIKENVKFYNEQYQKYNQLKTFTTILNK